MENSFIDHDTVLILIIGVIIIVQFYIFYINYRKIQDYKKTIEKTKGFKIVEVAVPEELIKEIEVDEILRNPEAFQNISSEFTSKVKEDPKDVLDPNDNFNDPDQNLDNEEEFSEELKFPDASELEEGNEAYDDDFEYEEYKNNKK